MISELAFREELRRIILTGLAEDVGEADHSSLACIPKNATGQARLVVKDNGIIAGVAFARLVFEEVDKTLKFTKHMDDGNVVSPGDTVFHVKGNVQSILKSERLLLNVMQRMSAIATKTNMFVKLLEGTSTKLLDTRKTSPGLRSIEKWAVRIGGGHNHRFGLYDMIMLKDNHIDFAKGISNAIASVAKYVEDNRLCLKVVVEAGTLDEVSEILLQKEAVHRILLDNFDYENTREAVRMINHALETESSGNINENNIRKYADCGVDFVSCGAITHSVYAMDLSLKA